ncbi:MAG: efflux RND transporter periplasmic adaptor subunit [Cyclobacteriaceae bacterium]|jgi:cobalt-zinc-cadmium efflux system membrane fusion protein|nr:efflux RND transporter periplasmic adaptor subunit [Cyclobacteriaceae bacterium]
MNYKNFGHTILISTGLMLTACSTKESAPAGAIDISENPHVDEIVITKAQFEAAGMKLGLLEQQTFDKHIKANGYIDVPPERKASVSVKFGGFVKTLSILPGDKVKLGAVLFTLENPEYLQLQQDYLETRALLTYLQSDYERQKALASENIASQKNYLKAESDYLVAKARLEGLREKLRMISINMERLDKGNIEPVVNLYSPINGFISKVNITRGVFVAPADVAVEIVDTDHMHTELLVFEKDVADIRKGQKINFQVTGSLVKHTGEVYLVGRTIESDTRTVNIHGHIHEEESISDLLPGMYVEATIDVASVQRPVLPAEAVVSIDNVQYALVLLRETPDEYRFKRLEVTTGQFNNQWIEIVNASSIQPDTKFLVKGAFNLVME